MVCIVDLYYTLIVRLQDMGEYLIQVIRFYGGFLSTTLDLPTENISFCHSCLLFDWLDVS